MFVTFVLAVLMFAVSPVSADSPCDLGDFCDRDSDGWIKVHKKCAALCSDEFIDCDDSFPDEYGNCEGDPSGGDKYTVELTGGPFQFGTDPLLPVYVTVNSKGNLNSDEGALLSMLPPSEGDALDAWNLVFDTCARDFSYPPLTTSIPSFGPNDWGIGTNSESDIHIDLKNIMVEEDDADDVLQRKEIQIHLRGTPAPLGQFLPACDGIEDWVDFELTTYKVWGKPWTGPGRAWDTCFLSENGNVFPGPEPEERFYSTLTITCASPP